MCELCDENGGEMLGCQNCGRLICFDIKGGDDVCQPAFVTSSGDLFCRRCGIRYEQEEERIMEEEAVYGYEENQDLDDLEEYERELSQEEDIYS